jgi:quercetin dioxygenase-like cupin family protein
MDCLLLSEAAAGEDVSTSWAAVACRQDCRLKHMVTRVQEDGKEKAGVSSSRALQVFSEPGGRSSMKIIECGTVPTIVAPERYFTGRVLQTPLIDKPEPARLRCVLVSFEPNARTHWHTHPLGQTLFVTAGSGLVQSWGGPVLRIRAGDVVSFEPGEKHWHGASGTTAMTHIAMQEALDGVAVEWLEPVSDEQYAAL